MAKKNRRKKPPGINRGLMALITSDKIGVLSPEHKKQYEDWMAGKPGATGVILDDSSTVQSPAQTEPDPGITEVISDKNNFVIPKKEFDPLFAYAAGSHLIKRKKPKDDPK